MKKLVSACLLVAGVSMVGGAAAADCGVAESWTSEDNHTKSTCTTTNGNQYRCTYDIANSNVKVINTQNASQAATSPVCTTSSCPKHKYKSACAVAYIPAAYAIGCNSWGSSTSYPGSLVCTAPYSGELMICTPSSMGSISVSAPHAAATSASNTALTAANCTALSLTIIWVP